MDQNWRPAVQVVINSHAQAPTGAVRGQAQPRERPLTVEEALQFSPMYSAPIFGLGELLRVKSESYLKIRLMIFCLQIL